MILVHAGVGKSIKNAAIRNMDKKKNPLVVFLFFFIKYLRPWLLGRRIFDVYYENHKFKFLPRSIDIFTFYEVFLDRQYDTYSSNDSRIIFDIGANIGLYTLWAAKTYSPERIISVEMNKHNYSRLNNLVKINGLEDKVSTINTAFYKQETSLGQELSQPFLNSCHKLDDSKKGTIKTITLSNLLQIVDGRYVDIIKMDIEGSEKFLMSKENAVLLRKRVREIVIEVHPQLGCSVTDMSDFLKSSGFDIEYRRYINPMMGGCNTIIIGKNKFS
jgi:FkbM family methyltransferase